MRIGKIERGCSSRANSAPPSSLSSSVSTETMTLTNNGDFSLNWYLYDYDDAEGTPVFLSNDDSAIPAWLEIGSYSGSIDAGDSFGVTLTFDTDEMSCDDGYACVEHYEWYFYQTGAEPEDATKIRAELHRSGIGPTPPTPTPPSPTPAAETEAPTSAPTFADCNNAFCSHNGRCASDECTCFPGEFFLEGGGDYEE